MNKEVFINKVVITPEAECDYDDISNLNLFQFNKTNIKNDLEEYIDLQQASGRLLYCRYFRVSYYDEQLDEMLMLFFYKGETFGKMQMWNVKGICKEEDWSEELEETGDIRFWLNTKVSDIPERIDWVERLRDYEEDQEKLMEEAIDECKRMAREL